MGLNDRYYGYNQVNKNITSDIHVDDILNRMPPERIWFGTDYHFYKWDDKKKKIYKNPDYDKIIDNFKIVEKDDIFIFLGDLIDDECQNYAEIKAELTDIFPGYYKIFILGNNDLQPESYYYDLGFDEVFYAYQWYKFTFSHLPLAKFDTTYNIHGHMHEWWDYNYEGITYNNHIKLYTKDFNNKPINLRQVVDLWNKGYFLDHVNKK